MTERGGGRFPQMFAEEFVKSYERQIGEYKRLNPSDSPKPAVKLEPLSEQDYEEQLKRTINDELEDVYSGDLEDDDSVIKDIFDDDQALNDDIFDEIDDDDDRAEG
jgi:hypothetical protein